MRRSLVLAGLLLLTAGAALAQDDYPRIETAPAFMYVRIIPGHGSKDFNCYGGGGTLAYNLNSWLGLAADLGGCKVTGLPSGLSLNAFTYVFGPRITYRNSSKFQPFFEINLGGTRLSGTFNSNNNGTFSSSTNAFAMTAGGGFDFKLTKKIAFRVIQAEYFYTRFGNNIFNNSSQNNFRLKSGIVIGWGGGS
jgi:opacity protein-like surface antigen